MLWSSCSSLERKLCSIKSSVMNKTPNQIPTQINDDGLGFHFGLASLLHQVPCISLGCRLRLHPACSTAISLLVSPSLPGAASSKGKTGRWGTWKPPPNRNDRMDWEYYGCREAFTGRGRRAALPRSGRHNWGERAELASPLTWGCWEYPATGLPTEVGFPSRSLFSAGEWPLIKSTKPKVYSVLSN